MSPCVLDEHHLYKSALETANLNYVPKEEVLTIRECIWFDLSVVELPSLALSKFLKSSELECFSKLGLVFVILGSNIAGVDLKNFSVDVIS